MLIFLVMNIALTCLGMRALVGYTSRAYEMPESCEGLSYCKDKGQHYPTEVVNMVLRKVRKIQQRIGEEIDDYQSRVSNSPSEPECNTTEIKFEPIYYILDQNNQARVVVQSEQHDFWQKYDIRWCKKVGRVYKTLHFRNVTLGKVNMTCSNVMTTLDFQVLTLNKLGMELISAEMPQINLGVLDTTLSDSTANRRMCDDSGNITERNNGHQQRGEGEVLLNRVTIEVKEKKQDNIAEDEVQTTKKNTKMSQARHLVKITLLIGMWIFFTVMFLMYDEKIEIIRHSSVAPGEVKDYILDTEQAKLSIYLKLTGPFISEQYEKKLNDSVKSNITVMRVWLEKWHLKKDVIRPTGADDIDVIQFSRPWIILLENANQIDFQESQTRSVTLELDITYTNRTMYAVRMSSNSNVTVPFTLSYTVDPLDPTAGIIYAMVLLCTLYVLIIFEIINRTMAALLLSTASLAVLSMAGERPTLTELVTWVDVETLLLLFSMMLLVALMTETGIFDYIAVLTFQFAEGRIWPLITSLCAITSVVSLLLDNVTTVLFMTPVTIRLCEVMNMDPIPVLMAMVLFCNLGGTATPVGDPPNVIIVSNKLVVQAGINFTNFSLHMTVGVLLVCVQTYLHLRFIFRDTRKLMLTESREILGLRNQISMWQRATESLSNLSRDEHVVRKCLERKIRKLTAELDTLVSDSRKRPCPKVCFENVLADMRQKYQIRDKPLLLKCAVALGFVVIAFFLHSLPEFNRVSLGWTALLGALLLLTLADREDLEPVLHKVEWSTLLFFAALFVLMEALAKLGLIDFIGGWTEALILKVDEKNRLAVALVLMVWVSGMTSAFVDNVPLTTMMIRVVTSLGTNPTLNLPMTPLIWALSFGVCLGGNGTLIGASSNVICTGVAERHGYGFTFLQFFKIGFPVMLGHLVVATGYLLLCHCVFQWH
ncbi:unnamed protein product [Arctia plantaginis]|uniref:Citrate transporter-like domain-containing protein n=1 Tax=Arctia plantaginis TaxID=874455 RepID=A0A8S0ZKY3_ARCPL|nr:unnamed protein product [Arctia plantaginis]